MKFILIIILMFALCSCSNKENNNNNNSTQLENIRYNINISNYKTIDDKALNGEIVVFKILEKTNNVDLETLNNNLKEKENIGKFNHELLFLNYNSNDLTLLKNNFNLEKNINYYYIVFYENGISKNLSFEKFENLYSYLNGIANVQKNENKNQSTDESFSNSQTDDVCNALDDNC